MIAASFRSFKVEGCDIERLSLTCSWAITFPSSWITRVDALLMLEKVAGTAPSSVDSYMCFLHIAYV